MTFSVNFILYFLVVKCQHVTSAKRGSWSMATVSITGHYPWHVIGWTMIEFRSALSKSKYEQHDVILFVYYFKGLFIVFCIKIEHIFKWIQGITYEINVPLSVSHGRFSPTQRVKIWDKDRNWLPSLRRVVLIIQFVNQF